MDLKIFIKHNRYRFLLSFIYLMSALGILLVFFADINPLWLLAGLLWSKLVQLIGHSIGMHRYFSHKSFTTTPFWHQVMCWVSILLGTGSPIAYARNHRFHHKVVDTPRDLHSPSNDGKFKTFIGRWEFHDLKWFLSKGSVMVRDWVKDPTCRFIDRYYYKIWVGLIVVSALIDWRICVYLVLFPAFIYHLELNIFVNCVGHSWGYRNYSTADTSRNNQWVSLWTLGEGLHNNHHAKSWLYDFATRPKEFDPSGWVIRNFIAIADGQETLTGKFKENLGKGLERELINNRPVTP